MVKVYKGENLGDTIDNVKVDPNKKAKRKVAELMKYQPDVVVELYKGVLSVLGYRGVDSVGYKAKYKCGPPKSFQW